MPRLLLSTRKGTAVSVAVVIVAAAIGGWLWLGRSPRAVNADIFGVAIKGYDPVAYFTEGRARKGSSDLEYEWDGARWRFASAAHRELFAANPDRYLPQYGGH